MIPPSIPAKSNGSRPLRVCVVVENHPQVKMGGAEYQAHLLAEELAGRSGVEVTFLARGLTDGAKLTGLKYDVRCLGDAVGIRRHSVLFDAPKLWRTLRELRPDVIYQRMKQSYSAVCSAYARRSGIPCVFHAASDGDLQRGGWRRKLSANSIFHAIEAAAGDWGVKRAAHVIVQTERQQGLLRDRFGLEAARVVANFQPLPSELPAKPLAPLRVLWVGNFKDVKRPWQFVELAERHAKTPGLEVVMVGRAPAHRQFADLLARMESVPNLVFRGELPLTEVNALMADSHFFVNTSSFEGFPNTFIQAWARGAVVLSVDVDVDGGMEKRGIGFRTGSVEGVSEVINRLAGQPEERAAIAQRAFEWVHANHSLASAARLADLIIRAGTDAQRRREAHPACITIDVRARD